MADVWHNLEKYILAQLIRSGITNNSTHLNEIKIT